MQDPYIGIFLDDGVRAPEDSIFDNLALSNCARVSSVTDFNPPTRFVFRIFPPYAFKPTLNTDTVAEKLQTVAAPAGIVPKSYHRKHQKNRRPEHFQHPTRYEETTFQFGYRRISS